MRIGFVRWVSDAPSGGNLYDDQLIAGLRARGANVVVRDVAGLWPGTGPGERERFTAALRAESASLVDGILASAAPDLIAAAVAAGCAVTIVVHHFAADDPSLDPVVRARHVDREAAALRAASGVLCTSRWAAAELGRRYGLAEVGVASPGVAPAEPAVGSVATGAPRLLALGSLTPSKDQLTLVAALGRVADLPWTARLVGSDGVDPGYADRVRRSAGDPGLGDRIEITGARIGAALDSDWKDTDLLVHPSRSETYGIVVLEALARGIPAMVTAGTGAVEAQAAGTGAGEEIAGTSLLPADAGGWAAALRTWLTDASLRRSWRTAALRQRERLPPWSATAEAALAYLQRSG